MSDDRDRRPIFGPASIPARSRRKAAASRLPLLSVWNLQALRAKAGAVWQGMELDRVRELMDLLGVNRTPWLGRIDFWIVRREAIETEHELVLGFWHKAKEASFSVEVSACLAFAEQMLGGGH